jgi:hypothetical protein
MADSRTRGGLIEANQDTLHAVHSQIVHLLPSI